VRERKPSFRRDHPHDEGRRAEARARLHVPLSADRAVDLIVTEAATFAVDAGGLVLVEIAEGVEEAWIAAHTAAPYRVATGGLTGSSRNSDGGLSTSPDGGGRGAGRERDLARASIVKPGEIRTFGSAGASWCQNSTIFMLL
jgi:hypothetical protein